jgi:hypothetical protein
MRTSTRVVVLSKKNDPFADKVVLFLKGDGVNNSTDIIDSSPNPKTITRFGDAKISTEQSKYGGSSIIFPVSNPRSYLVVSDSSDFIFGTDDFTVEMYLYFITTPIGINNGNTVLDMRPDGINGAYLHLGLNPTNRKLGLLLNNVIFECSNTLSLATQYHIAVSRIRGTLKVFVDGVQTYTETNTDNLLSGTIKIADNAFRATAPDVFANVYIDSLRITRACRYTANFNSETDTYLK